MVKGLNTVFDPKKKAIDNFDNIKKSIKGLYDILNFSMTNDDLYFEAGIENIIGLYQNILELIFNEDGFKDLIKRLKNSEIELDIDLKN